MQGGSSRGRTAQAKKQLQEEEGEQVLRALLFVAFQTVPLTGKRLSLSGNRLGDEGCRCLLESLPRISISEQLE